MMEVERSDGVESMPSVVPFSRNMELQHTSSFIIRPNTCILLTSGCNDHFSHFENV